MRTFEKNRYKANMTCPCGKDNRFGKFATEKGFSGQPIGKCFRCDKNFYEDSIELINPIDRYIPPVDFCRPQTKDLEDSFDYDLKSGFAKFLVNKFGVIEATKVAEKYYLGVYDFAHGANHQTIFWQVDRDTQIRCAKIIAYLPNGKRDKTKNPNWWHSLNNQNCQIRQCFFGDHLIPDYDLPIAVVESAKTALIMDIMLPQYIWLSSEGATGLQDHKCISISDYDVTLFPDSGWYNDSEDQKRKGWKSVADKYGFKISSVCEILTEQGKINDKDDIADYYLKYEHKKPIDPEWSWDEYNTIFK